MGQHDVIVINTKLPSSKEILMIKTPFHDLREEKSQEVTNQIANISKSRANKSYYNENTLQSKPSAL